MRRLAVLVVLVLLALPVVYGQTCSGDRTIVSAPDTCSNTVNAPRIECTFGSTVADKGFYEAYHVHFSSPTQAQDIISIAASGGYGEVMEWGIDTEDGQIIILQNQNFFTGNNGYFPFSFDVNFADFITQGKLQADTPIKSIVFMVSSSGRSRSNGFDIDSLTIETTACTTDSIDPCDPCNLGAGCPYLYCGDALLCGTNEQCDDGNFVDGDGCNRNCLFETGSGGPGSPECGNGICESTENAITCPQDCSNEGANGDIEVNAGLFNIGLIHNILFANTLDLTHISKDAVFQAEVKEIEKGLRDAYLHPPNSNPCQVVPNLFMLTPNFHPYGKENEIDAYNNLLLFILNNPTVRGQVRVSDTQYTSAVSLQIQVNDNLIAGNFLTSAQAKCCLYNQFIVPSIIDLDVDGICQIMSVCGNGILEPGEECDDGNFIDCDGCSYPSCEIEFCGDGDLCATPPLNEQCDDGNNIDGDGCEADCTDPFCDNGVLDPDEECDDPPGGDLPETDTDCPFNVNGFQICGATCQCEECGNGITEPGEECDDGDTDSGDGCDATCNSEFCGDGITQAGLGEECDDANLDNTDGCTITCQLPECGDGFEQPGSGEECDDGNFIDCDGCSYPSCEIEFCGDGDLCATPPLSEACDDGNNDDGDSCEADCTLPFCNNGIVDSGETCDPPPAGGLPESDTANCEGIGPEICGLTCNCEQCGNGIIESTEVCDEGDTDNGDGCNSNCQPEFCGDGFADSDGPNNIPGDSDDEECGEPSLEPCADGKICSSCECVTPHRSSGGSHPEVQAGCGNGGQYTIRGGQAAYVIDVNGQRIDLTGQMSVAVGPVCCFDDCCNNYCSAVNPGSVCLSPAFDRNNHMLKNFLPVCRKPSDADKKLCLSKSESFCFEVVESQAPPPAVERVVQQTAASGEAVRLAECESNDDCTPGFVCQNGACVQRQSPAQTPRVVPKTSFDNPIAIALIAVILLALLTYMILKTRPRMPKPAEPENLMTKPVEKPAPKAEPKPVKQSSGYEPSKVEEDLEALEKSYDKINEMLKSMRRKF